MATTSLKRWTEFVQEALAADAAIEKGGPVYRCEDVHRWMEQLAKTGKAARPKPIHRS